MTARASHRRRTTLFLRLTFLFGLPLVLVHFLFGPPVPSGTVSIHPATGVAGEFGTWTVTYQVGEEGIGTGGGIRVQLPDSWHSWIRNSAKRLQATDPRADHYVSARSSRPGVELKTVVESEPEPEEFLVKSGRESLDGRVERYVFVVRVELTSGRLQPGDTLSVIYGDTSGGSLGMEAAVISTVPEPVLVAVDVGGNGGFQLLPDRPLLQCQAGPASELLLTGPSMAVVGEPVEVHLAVVDRLANPAPSLADEIRLHLVEGEADLPERVRFQPGRAWQVFEVIPRKAGLIRIRAQGQASGLQAAGNPIKVFDQAPARRIFWGDLHSHTKYSWDGVGENNFEYARHISALDFYAMTDHSSAPREGRTHGLGPQVWEEYTRLTDEHYAPGRFVTLHAYEASFGAPYGHHNVFFRSRPGPLLAPEAVTLPQLWASLQEGQALTIPHHTGKFPPVDWQYHHPGLRRNFEIYSAHGLSEAYDPGHPLAFEQSLFTAPGRSVTGPQFAQDAWARGLVLSTIAASDDHRAHPGQPHWGLAAVAATELTREAIFDALYERRSYGTTGTRILLDFTINGEAMGREIQVEQAPRLSVTAHGTAPIEEVELLRYTPAEGRFRVIRAFQPGRLDFEWSGQDESFSREAIYYVRLRQTGWIRDRIAMAWSSPIWVRAR